MKYWAFISYSNKDRRWGQWMRRRLENYRISKDLRGREFPDGMLLDKRLRPVFLDRDELSSSADLSQSIKDALNESRCLVVLCSPHAANSAWVNKEVEAFRDMGKSERIFPVILAGEPNSDDPDTECFPPALRLPFEPLAADFRKSGDGKVRGFLKILAAIARLDLDQLYQRHERAARRSRFAWGTIALSLILVFGLLAVVAWWQRDLAQHANRISTARYLASRSQALRTEDIHLSRSLAAEGSVLLDSVETRRALFDTMQFSPSIYRFLATERQGWGQYVTISPDGEQAAYTSGAGDVWVWELDHKHLLLHLQTKNHRPIHFSNDGKFLYRVDQAGDVEKWRISTGEMVQHLDLKLQGFNFSGRAPEAFFHPDGSLVAITTSTQLRLFSLDSGKALSPLLPLKDGVDTLDFSADGKRAAYARDRLITLFEIQTGKIISQTKISDGYVTGLGLSPDLSQALAEIQSSSNPLQVPGMVGKSAGVAFIDLVNQKPASRLLPLHHGSVTSVVFSQDGRIVASGDREGRIVLLDADNHEMIELLHGHQKVITDISFSYDAKRMVSGDISGTAIVWDLSDIREENVNSPFGELIADRSARITSMDVVKSRNDIVVADNSGRVSLFDLDGVETERVLRSGSGFVPIAYTVSVGNKDNWIGAIDNQGQLTIWDMDGSLLMGSVIAHRSESFQHSAVDIHPLKALVATAGSDGQVLLWREANSEWFTEQLMEAEDGFTDVAFSHSGQFLAVASRERLIIWKLNGALSKVLELDSNSALAISFDRSPVIAWSPDDTHIAY
ncbi:MAG: TIR domain-containing protein, partial [Chromatiales bacterium]